MDLKVTVNDNCMAELTFPCLMAAPHFDRKQIILATGIADDGNYIGTNLNGVGWDIGHHSSGWAKSSFVPWFGSVTVSAPKGN